MDHWTIGHDQESVEILIKLRVVLANLIPHWHNISSLAERIIKSMDFSRQRVPLPGHGPDVMTQTYSFEEAHEVVGTITKALASYWETECYTVKKSRLLHRGDPACYHWCLSGGFVASGPSPFWWSCSGVIR